MKQKKAFQMQYTEEFRPDFVDPIPEPRELVKRLMLATAIVIDGYLDQEPEAHHPWLENCFLAPEAGIIIAGTGCRRPLLLREVGHVADAVSRDAIIVRSTDQPRPHLATFDVKIAGMSRMLCGYFLWRPQPSGDAYLIPSVGDGPHVRLDRKGMELVNEPPFDDEVERYRGIQWGSELLSVASTGWL
ncbi:hypothetical protein WJT74_01205 [Sphingomicrobium sp. XHP0239]|uniref:hypothetical protein n=1 Tax=Sphingomicrobium maritimum TaxID=3133972 RepID=UPI0031CCD4F0